MWIVCKMHLKDISVISVIPAEPCFLCKQMFQPHPHLKVHSGRPHSSHALSTSQGAKQKHAQCEPTA